MKYVTSFFIIIFFLTSCQTTSHQKAGSFYIANGIMSDLIPLSKFNNGDITISNTMESHYKNSAYTATSVVKISQEEMKVIALSDIARLFTITFKNGEINSEFSALIPAKDDAPFYILSDIQLIYFPLSAIKSGLPAEMKIVQTWYEAGIQRKIYSKNKQIITITYSKPDLYTSDIEFENSERSYSYKITYIGD